jgi:hypothetical protein
LRYLLGRLPPWITTADWERGDSVQVLLSILWPAINSTVCAILRRELEERVQESSDFGHIAFSRLSFGKHPPVIVGIKAVPLHGEDLLAMVLDVDIRWAGEPDVALHLTKLGGASLGLSNVHLAGVVRLVFSPITEDPPFLRRMAVSLLNRPYVDFSVRALGGPDLMALPAISSWLHSVVLTLADKAIVWPKEVGVPLAPRPASEAREEDAAEAAALLPPMGILVVKILSADIEPRRSTFLGRMKVPSPRVSLVLPEASGPDGADEGVMQAGITAVQEKTLSPEWNSQFNFVISRPTQQLRLLVSHKRMELLGADMPLGLADLPLEDILADYHAMQDQRQFMEHAECVVLDTLDAAAAELNLMTAGGGGSSSGSASGVNANVLPYIFPNGTTNNAGVAAGTSSPTVASFDDADDSGFNSASSSPIRSRSLSPSLSMNSGVLWASPSASLTIPPELYHQPSGAIGSGGGVGAPAMAVRTRSVQVHWPESITQAMEASGTRTYNPSTSNGNSGEILPVGLGGSSLATPRKASIATPLPASATGSTFRAASAIGNVQNTPPTSHKYSSANHTSSLRPSSSRKLPASSKNRLADNSGGGNDSGTEDDTAASWVSPDGIWITIPAATSVTMAGMVSNAVDTRSSNTSAGGELHRMASTVGDQGQTGWLKSIQSMVFGINREYDNVVADHEDEVVVPVAEEGEGGSSGGAGNVDDGDASGSGGANNTDASVKSAGRVRIVVQWLPVATADVVAAAAAAVAAAEAEAAELRKQRRRKKNKSKDAPDDEAALSVAAKEKELYKKANGRSGNGTNGVCLESVDDDGEENLSSGASLPSSDQVVKALSFKDPSLASTSRPPSDTGSFANLEAAAAAGNGNGNGMTIESPAATTNTAAVTALNPVLTSPRLPTLSALSRPGILALRITFTKLDYGDSPGNPVLALSIGNNVVAPLSSVAAAAAAAAVSPPERMVCMDCQAGGRPGLLHWGRVFHLPVWDPLASRALLELGDAKSSWKLSTYGGELYALDACADFDSDVTVEAAASIPLKDVVTKGVVRGSWRLREARGRRGTTVAVGPGGEHEQLDVGRVALVMAWFPLAG